MAEPDTRLDSGAVPGSGLMLRFVDSVNEDLGGVRQVAVRKSDYQIGTIVFYESGPQFEQWASSFNLDEMKQITGRMEKGPE